MEIAFLKTLDPFWISVGPLLICNVFFLLTFFFFCLTYKRQAKNGDVDLKAHSWFLSRFLKEYWYWMTGPVARLMVKLRMTPNVITVLGFLLSCVAGFFFHLGMVGAGGWFMILGATFDMFDGHIARLTGKATKSGAFFDSVMDRFSEGVVFLGLASFYRSTWILYFVILGLVGSMMVSYTRARGEGVGVDVKTGLMQRPERIVYLGVGSIFSPIFAHFLAPIIKLPVDFLTIGAVVLIAVMTNITAMHRMGVVMKRLGPLSSKDAQRQSGLSSYC